MKKIITFVLTLTILWSCKEEDANTIPVGIDIQSFFDQDKVQLSIDSKEWIDKELQTMPALGLCVDGRITIKLNEGTHTIKVTINDITKRTEIFTLTKDLYIGVNYDDQTKEISIIYSEDPFTYD